VALGLFVALINTAVFETKAFVIGSYFIFAD
jgi:hypothetical protein